MTCPLCDHLESRPSWLGSIIYRGREFPYAECLACRSLYCEPMPDDEMVAQMYGTGYSMGQTAPNGPATDDPRVPLRVVEWLKGKGPGTFLDYGCRDGALLTEAAKLNWLPVGVELDEEVARRAQESTGLRVVTPSDELLAEPLADVLHLGDVIEHLTGLDRQMPEILRLLKPGGILLAQGPLEANANLFTLALRLSRKISGPRRTEMAPKHVLLATAKGQRKLFRRFGLEDVEYAVYEVSWPAPSRISLPDLSNPRTLGLYTLRRCSRLVSAFFPNRWGNRYFYAGRKAEVG